TLRLLPFEHLIGIGRIPQDGHAGRLGHRFLQQFQQFPADLGGLATHPREVPTRLREAGHQPHLHRIPHEGHNGNRSGGVLRCLGCWRPHGHEDVHREVDQLGGEGGEAVKRPRGPACRKHQRLALHVAEFVQPLPEWLKDGCSSGGGGDRQESYQGNFRRRLPVGCPWCPEERKGEREHEPAGPAAAWWSPPKYPCMLTVGEQRYTPRVAPGYSSIVPRAIGMKKRDRLRPQLIELTIFALTLLGPSGGVATNLRWASATRAARKDAS